MIGFNYPNSNYLRGGYGVRTPSRHDHSYYHAATGLAHITGLGSPVLRRCDRNGGRHRRRAVSIYAI